MSLVIKNLPIRVPKIPHLYFLCLFVLSGYTCKEPSAGITRDKINMNITPPIAKKIPHTLSLHGDVRVDPYYWMKNRNDPDLTQYLEEENRYHELGTKDLESFREQLYQEIIGRIKQTDMSVPYFKNGYYYITRYEEGKEHPIYSRKAGNLEEEEEILLDVNELSEEFPFYQIGSYAISPDNSRMVFGEDTLSRRIYTLRFKDLKSGKYLEEEILNTTGVGVWANDNETVFYITKDESLRPYKVFRHIIGTDPVEDVEVFHESDSTFTLRIHKTKSDQFIVIGSISTISTEFKVVDADQPNGQYITIHPREPKHEYFIDHYKDLFYIRTNWQAENFRLMTVEITRPVKSNWKEMIPHRENVLLEDLEVFKDFLVLSERIKGTTQIRILPREGEDHYIRFPEPVYMAYTSINPEFNTENLRITYNSLTTPVTTYDYNMRTRHLSLLKRQEVLGGYDPSDYSSERLFAQAGDGVSIPISIVYRKGYKKDSAQPLLLYGYGSYGFSMDPYFSFTRISLLDRGFAFAIAHIRGGEELGRKWYEDGKLLQKKNTFLDFIACAEYLIAKGYTSPDHLYAMGGSAGGLLMGAIANIRPDLFHGIIAAVPFVDVLTTMLDESIPLTTGEYDEWGDPGNKVFYQYIKSYSPYDNIERKDYPALLVTTGLHDSQVQYWEPAKWVAKLRDLKTDDHPLYLHCNMDAGHSGASGRFERHVETAMMYSFLLDLAGRIHFNHER